MHLPNTLFARTGLTISVTLLVFILFTGFVIFNYLLLPVGRQGAGDLATLMVLSAKIWVDLPPETRHDFEAELRENHDLLLQSEPPAAELEPLTFHSPYMLFLEDAFTSRLGTTTHVHQVPDDEYWYWVIIPVAERKLYLGFSHDHIGAKPPRAVLIIMFGAGLFIMLTTLLLVRRITRPLAILAEGVKRLGSGGLPEPLPEDGPLELALLASKFNQLSGQIQQLLKNRTTLLGGISHDLRTPLARLRIALELLHGKEEAELLQRMQQDLEEMDLLICRTLELAKMMQIDNAGIEEVDLPQLLKNLVASYEQNGKEIDLALPDSCRFPLSAIALRRVLTNLLDNAFHYTGEKEVTVQIQCNEQIARICVLDRGPGIPADQIEKVFQPFYRLDPSRNRSTGGSGLGLAIVQQLAELHGWTITLANRKNGGLSACIEVRRSSS